MIKRLALVGVVRWMGLVGLLWMGSLSSSSASGQGLPNFTELVKQQMPAVVSLSVTQRREMGGSKHSPFSQGPDGLPYEELPELFRRFFEDRGLGLGPNGPTEPPQFESQAQGSGSILTEDGYILTNHHVVENADEIMVRLYDHREFRAEVVGSDARSDIALIKIDAVDLPTIKTGTSKDLEVGEWVLAIGSPFCF